MTNPFEAAGGRPGGTALEGMARQYGLSLDQAQRAFEALLPAFLLAMQRSAADPEGLAKLFGAPVSSQPGRFYDSPGQASPAAPSQAGAELMGRLFGSPEVARKVAEQAAAMTGIGLDMMARVLPAMAAAFMGGLSQAGAGGDVAPLQGARPDPNRSGAAVAAVQPWQAMLEAMRGFPGLAAAGPAEPGPGAPASDPFGVWRGLFQTGREVQELNMTAMRNLLDMFWGAPPDRPETEAEPPAGTASRREPG